MPTRISTRNLYARGWIKGQPIDYIHGHARRDTSPNPEYVVDSNGCWIWQRSMANNGYGVAYVWGAHGKKQQAHRMVYEREVGPIPAGMQLDHLCRVRRCVNPAHLEPVTQAENIRRGMSPSAVGVRHDVCRNGHSFTPDSTAVRGNGSRRCRTCTSERMRRDYWARKGQVPPSSSQ